MDLELLLEAQNKITAELKKISSGLSDIDKTAENTSKGGVSSLDFKMTALAVTAGTLVADALKSAGRAALDVGKSMLQGAANAESQQIAFETLLGSTDLADAALNRIKEDAKRTPFELPGLIDMNKRLVSAGLAADRSADLVLDLGDAVSATGGSSAELNRLIANMQQVQSVGKASAQDIKQFGFAGIPIFDLLSESIGVTSDTISDMVTNGEIGFDEIESAFQGASEEGGRFFQAMDDQSKTFIGITSNVADTLGIMGTELLQQSGIFDLIKASAAGFLGVIETLQPVVSDLVAGFTEFLGTGDATNEAFTSFFESLGLGEETIANITDLLGDLREGFLKGGDAVGELVTKGFNFLIDNKDAIINFFVNGIQGLIDFGKTVKEVITTLSKNEKVVGFFTKAFELVGSILKKVGPIAEKAVGFFTKAFESVGSILEKVGPIAKDFWENTLRPFLEKAGGDLKELGEELLPKFQEAWEKLQPSFEKLQEAFQKLEPVFSLIGAIIGGVVVVAFELLMFQLNLVGTVLSAIIPIVVEIVTTFVDMIGNMVQFVKKIIEGDFSGAWESVVDLFDNIGAQVVNFAKLIIGTIKDLVEGVIGFFENLFDVLVGHSIIPDLVNAIIKWFKDLVEKVTNFVKGLFEKIVFIWNAIKDRVMQVVANIVSFVIDKFRDLAVKIREKIDLIKIIIEALREKFDEVKTKIIGIKDDIVDGFEKLKEKVTGVIEDIKRPFDTLIDKFNEVKNAVPDISLGNLNIPGFATGGEFTVGGGGGGGTDSQLVAFKATPGEKVTIETPAQQAEGNGGGPKVQIGEVTINNGMDFQAFQNTLAMNL